MLEIGSIVEGKVTGLTGFGAFVSLPDGSSGMVHISEVSTSFVKDIKDWDSGVFILGAILIIVAGIVCCCQVYDIIKCVSFPELYVFEYIKHALNT